MNVFTISGSSSEPNVLWAAWTIKQPSQAICGSDQSGSPSEGLLVRNSAQLAQWSTDGAASGPYTFSEGVSSYSAQWTLTRQSSSSVMTASSTRSRCSWTASLGESQI
jgi:hypothetical protein